jgi:23S rRNA (cytidine1920-2'-O)/16S rRNA (cytidine1409-2'-O)-methyltransferase
VAKRSRLDAELVRRGLVDSRTIARRAIEEGKVTVQGVVAPKPASLVSADSAISIESGEAKYVSRGGDKLAGALSRFEVEVRGRHWLDAGASTGGFTDCLLQAGASAVVAVDVGYGQFHWRLRNDPRVTLLERTNIRHLEPSSVPYLAEGVTADLSFISLTTVLGALARLAEPGADYILLVKPQFEAGRGVVGKKGVVRDPKIWEEAVVSVADAARELSLGIVDAAVSVLAGPAGNVEFFVHLRHGASARLDVIHSAVQEAGA